jgi:hypothetical protein
VTGPELLVALLGTLDELADLVELGRQRWDADRLVRLAVQKLWIDAGNYAEQYRMAVGIAAGVQPWSALYGYRSVLAHQLPEDLSEDRVWQDSTATLEDLRHQIRRMRDPT